MNFSKGVKLVGNGLPAVYVNIELCLETTPCRHYVTDGDKTMIMSRESVAKLYRERGLVPHVHFSDRGISGEDSSDDDDVEFTHEEVAGLIAESENGDSGHCGDCCGGDS